MNSETLPALISDGAGGAIIVHLGSNGCRAYRLNSLGVSLWGTTILGTLTNNRRPAMVTDGSGGAVVGWAAGNTGIFVQRVTSVGNKAWTPTIPASQLNTTGEPVLDDPGWSRRRHGRVQDFAPARTTTSSRKGWTAWGRHSGP
jgi:hypothetical protein